VIQFGAEGGVAGKKMREMYLRRRHKMKRIIPLACITCIVLLLTFGCALEAPEHGDPDIVIEEEPLYPDEDEPDGSHNFELVIAETPSEIAGFEGIYIDFDKIEVSKGEGKDEEWITVNEDGGEVDILYLAGGGEQNLALSDLEPGDYNELRFHVNKIWVIVDGEEIEMKISSKMLKFMKHFTIKEGEITQLVADFDFHETFRHVHYFKHFKFFKYLLKKFMLKPVIRMMKKHEVGMIKGKIVYPEKTEITVNAYRHGEDEIYKTTNAFCNGWFYLAYMEEGYYDVVFEAEGYTGRVDKIKVKVGKISYIGKIKLEEVSESNSITVNIEVTDPLMYGRLVYVTSYPRGGNIEDNAIETVQTRLTGGAATVTLENYSSGEYDIRAHIDRDEDGELTPGNSSDGLSRDFVGFGSVNVIDSPEEITISGPWGGYFFFPITVRTSSIIPGLDPPDPTHPFSNKTVHLVVVAPGGNWGNYRYGRAAIEPIVVLPDYPPMGSRYPACWGVDGFYDVVGIIDIDGDEDLSSGDYVASVRDIEISDRTAPNQIINESDWSLHQ
jgi:hypothetical protein